VPSVAGTLLIPQLGALYRHHPAIRLRVIAETSIASLQQEVGHAEDAAMVRLPEGAQVRARPVAGDPPQPAEGRAVRAVAGFLADALAGE
jgi:hypothetical protein